MFISPTPSFTQNNTMPSVPRLQDSAISLALTLCDHCKDGNLQCDQIHPTCGAYISNPRECSYPLMQQTPAGPPVADPQRAKPSVNRRPPAGVFHKANWALVKKPKHAPTGKQRLALNVKCIIKNLQNRTNAHNAIRNWRDRAVKSFMDENVAYVADLPATLKFDISCKSDRSLSARCVLGNQRNHTTIHKAIQSWQDKAVSSFIANFQNGEDFIPQSTTPITLTLTIKMQVLNQDPPVSVQSLIEVRRQNPLAFRILQICEITQRRTFTTASAEEFIDSMKESNDTLMEAVNLLTTCSLAKHIHLNTFRINDNVLRLVNGMALLV